MSEAPVIDSLDKLRLIVETAQADYKKIWGENQDCFIHLHISPEEIAQYYKHKEKDPNYVPYYFASYRFSGLQVLGKFLTLISRSSLFGANKYDINWDHPDMEEEWWMVREVLRANTDYSIAITNMLNGRPAGDESHTGIRNVDDLWQAGTSWSEIMGQEDISIKNPFRAFWHEYFPLLPLDKYSGKISYIPDAAHGKRDRRVVCKVGRFVGKTMPGIFTPEQVKQFSNDWQGLYGEFDIKIAHGDKIREIYAEYQHKGFSSCMGYPERDFEGDTHPCAVYDSPDIALAYIGDDDRKTVRARALINIPDQTVSTVYGDERLWNKLKSLGLEGGDLTDCRIQKIPYDRTYIMPYIDGECGVADYGDHFVITYHGEYSAENTSGLLESLGMHCGECGDYTHEEEIIYISAESIHICPNCVDRNFVLAYTSPHDEEYVQADDCVTTNEGNWWVENAAAYHLTYCEYNNTYYEDTDDLVYSEYMAQWYPVDVVIRAVDEEDGEADYFPNESDVPDGWEIAA